MYAAQRTPQIVWQLIVKYLKKKKITTSIAD